MKRKKIYKAQFPINLVLNNEIKKKLLEKSGSKKLTRVISN